MIVPADGGPGLSVASLVDEARARSGYQGDVPFTSTLELLVSSCARSARLSATGAQVLRRAALRHLRNLCDVLAHVDAFPDTPARPLPSPVVVTGLPRTGTTLLHNLLALDPARRPLWFWEALNPVPPGPSTPTVDERIARAEAWLEAFYRMAPEFRAIHPASATGPEECDALLQNTFASQHFDDMFDAGEYSTWLGRAPLAREYDFYALQLRALSASSPPGATWALKSPGHLGHLDALLGALPEATVVVCHRDPRQAVASYASLIATVRRPYTEELSLPVVGRQALARAGEAMERALAVRDGAAGRFVDVPYRRLADDPPGAVAAVYRDLGQPLTDEAVARMRGWVAENPRHRHGAHRYDLARFGLTEGTVMEAFAPYLERFGDLVDG
jgi:hypothetical protein